MRLLETEYCTIEVDPSGAFVRLTRSDLPYRTIGDIEREAVLIENALQGFSGRRMLVDLRAIAPRNDPEFEVAIQKVRQSLFRGSVRVAMLARTAIGALQISRHAREDGAPAQTFVDESLALAWLRALRQSFEGTDRGSLRGLRRSGSASRARRSSR